MSTVITSVENISIQEAPILNKCQFFYLTLRVVNNKNSGVNLFVFNFHINEGTLHQYTVQFEPTDIVSENSNEKVFEKSFHVPRDVSNIFPINYKIDTTSGLNVYNENSTALISAWSISDINVSTDTNGLGTVSIQTNILGIASLPLDIEISIDDLNYFNTNVITGISPGNYTLYVRDAYGCKKTTPIVISNETAFEVFNDFKFVSLFNPVPFTEINNNRKSFANTPSYRVDDNYLSKNNNYEYLQTDLSRFQFRSNYEINKAYLIDCNEVIEELPVQQRSENLNQRDIRDARFFFQDGFLHAYYDGTGSIYDNDGNVIGNNDLNGSLLFDQVQGELLSIESLGVIPIFEVVTIDGIGQVMKLLFTQPIAVDYLKITTYYELENFEVYEFDLQYARPVGNYQIVIINNATVDFDENNPLENATYISEVISVVEEFSEPKFKFVWKNSENNQFSWDTGIECYNYMPKSYEPEFQPKDENEIYTTDTTSFMLESEVYDVFIFVIQRIAQITARQLMLIASNDYLKIDDIFYVKEETPETLRLGVSNAYNVTLTLQLASNYNSNSREGLTGNPSGIDTRGLLRIE